MDRPYSLGEPVNDAATRKSHAHFVFGSLACLTGAVLIAAFVAPFMVRWIAGSW